MYFTISLMIILLGFCCFSCRSHFWDGYHFLLRNRLEFLSEKKVHGAKKESVDADVTNVDQMDIEINEIFSSADDMEKGEGSFTAEDTLQEELSSQGLHTTQNPIRGKTFMIPSVKTQRDSHLHAKKLRKTLPKETENVDVWMANPLSADERTTDP
jgi:hypothetical protein